MKMPEKKDFSSQLLPQLASDYPPPIWSLSSPHLIIGYRWICRISFHIFHHICSKWQCSEPHIMYYTIFGSGFSTYLPLGVDQANLVIYTLNFVLVLLGNATCTGMMYTTADWSSRFLRNITTFTSEFPHYWSAILKIRGGILQIREWTTARGARFNISLLFCFVCYIWQLWLLLKQTKWAGLNNWISSVFVCCKEMAGFNYIIVIVWMWLHEMKFVQIIEQHWTNYLGGWVAQSSLQGTAVFWQYLFYDFLSGPWPRENAIAIHNVVVSLSPGENGREHISVP